MSAAIRGHRATGLRTWQQHGRELARAGPADRAGRQPTRGSGARRAGSFLVDLRRLRFCNSYIGSIDPLQRDKPGTAIGDSGDRRTAPDASQPEEVEHAAPVHFWSTFALGCSWRHCWRIRFTSQLTSCCSRMTLLQPEGMAGQANQSCHPLIQYSRAARRPPARFCLAM